MSLWPLTTRDSPQDCQEGNSKARDPSASSSEAYQNCANLAAVHPFPSLFSAAAYEAAGSPSAIVHPTKYSDLIMLKQ